MTAICGLWQTEGRPDSAQRLRGVQARLRPYGRDRADLWDGDDIALASSLTRLVPEDRFDRQPLTGGGGRFTLVADLRLDNRDDVVRELGIAPEQAAAMADSDLLLAGFERWGTDVVTHLVGPFCFAIFDRAARTLTLARDHLGQRPLYFHRGAGLFAFATMPKALLALPEIPMAPNEALLIDFLLATARGTRDFFAGLEALDKGCVMTLRADGTQTVSRFWDPADVPDVPPMTPGDYAEGLRDVFTRAVASALRTDKPIGCTLSAGYDSSAVTVTAARLLAPHGLSLDAYTEVPQPGYVAPEREGVLNDEGPIAALTAARYANIRHHFVSPTGADLSHQLESAFAYADIPALGFVNGSWGRRIAQGASEAGIGVMLGGGFGNVSISYDGEGYLYELMQTGHWLELARALLMLRRSLRQTPVIAVKDLIRWRIGNDRWRRLRTAFARPAPTNRTAFSLLHRDLLASEPIQTRLRTGDIRDLANKEPQTREARNDWVRRAAGAWPTGPKGELAQFGIDRRDPTMDRRVVEFCLGVPLREYMRDGRPRALYRAAFADWLPPEVIRQGWSARGRQSADWHPVMKAALPVMREEVERMTGHPDAERLFDLASLRAAIDTFPDIDDGRLETERRYHLKLSRGIRALHFLRRAKGLN